MREAIARSLARRGCRVLTATNGVEGLEAVRAERFDAIITDLNMPERGGLRRGGTDAAPPAEPLLGRGTAATVTAALEAATRARIIVAGTPVYRATYSGLLKLFFDLLPQDCMIGKVGVPIVTGHAAAHSLSVDHWMRPVVASLGATVLASGGF